MDSFSSELQDLLRKVAQGLDLKEFTTSPPDKNVSKKEDGYIGIIESLDILNKEGNKALSLILKRAPISEKLRKQFPTRQAFLREIEFYVNVFPEFLQFQKEYNISKPFTNVTNCYGVITEEYKELLLLQNLKEEGFRLVNRQQPMDSNHLSLGLTVYGKLHAISHAMKRLHPRRFEKLTSNIKYNFMGRTEEKSNTTGPTPEEFNVLTHMLFDITLQALQDQPKLIEAVEYIQKTLTKETMSFMLSSDEFNSNEFAVVSHTDCWSANIMFKYDESDQNFPIDLKLIDWQTSFLCDPMYDFSYFLFINAGKNDLKDYKKYLGLYHQSLCNYLKDFGLDPSTFYPLELLHNQFKEKWTLGFYMCLLMMQQSLSTKKTHDFEELADQGKNVFDPKNRQIEMSDIFKQRMADLVAFIADNLLVIK
ncbi:uncharacterized protein [Euwallacea similis]|uniref:uncharacterized protein isoform X2 n=1 Tax=Euwallacea similis TaxID=1736056 RepID=UPI00344E73DB